MTTGIGRCPSGRAAAADAVEPSFTVSSKAGIPNAQSPELWAIAGSWPYFEVETTRGAEWNFLHTANDAAINGVHASKVAALASLIASLEDTRRELSGEIARHKRALRAASAIEARRAAATEIDAVADESAVAESQTPNNSRTTP